MNRIIKKITAAIAAAAMALSLAGCSDYVMTEEDLAKQKSIEGFWAADIDTGYDKFDESGNLVMVTVFEFTEDFKYFMHECYVNDRSSIMYGPVEYSFENGDFRVVTDGRVSYAKVNVSEDGQTMHWTTNDKTDTYKKLTDEQVEELGIIPYNPENGADTESGSDSSDTSADTSASESVSDSSDTDKDGASAEAAAMVLTPAEPSTPDTGEIQRLINKLDPSVKFGSADYTETPVVIAETEDGEIVLYGTYLNGDPIVFIERDGVIEYGGINNCYEQDWLTPREILPQVMYEDIDSDGEKELAVSYYVGSGTGISISELVIYEKNEDGGFMAGFSFDAVSALEEEAVINGFDDLAHTASFTVGGKAFTVENTDEYYPDGIKDISWGNIIEYVFNDGVITLNATPSANGWFYECMPDVTAQVVYTGDKSHCNAELKITDISLSEE